MWAAVAPRSHQLGIKVWFTVKFYQSHRVVGLLCSALCSSRAEISLGEPPPPQKKGKTLGLFSPLGPWFLMVCELCQPIFTCSMKGCSCLTVHYVFWFPDASPGHFHSCTCQTGRSFKWQGLSRWLVLLQPKRDQMSLHMMLQSNTLYLASGEATNVGPQGPSYEAVAMRHLGCQL